MFKMGFLFFNRLRHDRFKVLDFYEETIPEYLPDTFKRFVRVSRETCEFLCQTLGQFNRMHLRNPSTGGKLEMPIEKQVLMTLKYLASQETTLQISHLFGVTEYAFLKHKNNVIDTIYENLMDRFIVWPDSNELAAIANNFDNMGTRHFPNVVGAIDGSHIPIEPHVENPQAYFNRKKFHSVILQGVCKDDTQFTKINVGWPGRVHDAKVLRHSEIWERGDAKCQVGRFHLLGDGAYPLRRWLFAPYRDNGNLTRAQVNYNKSLSSKRQVIERAFGLLKGRFRRLKYVNLKDLGRICRTIAASCILHNIAVLNNDELEDMLEGDDDVADDNLVANLFDENDREGSLKRIRLTNQLNL